VKSRTFREWVKDGYLIIKGSKAVSFNEKDEALFAENQVRKKTIINYEYEGVDYSKDPEFWAKDDGEDSFHRRWDEELNVIEK
jgi:tagatose-1,6-bisphosphate aldolase non-catalytic subunit AgaZ/GatZ